MKTALAVNARENFAFPAITVPKTARFQKLSLEGINPDMTRSPVIKMLIQGDAVLASGRRCTIVPEDEMLIFLD
ncbi:MAG: hypothetical protein A2Y67_02850 [Candidatus Buchananbacteria bacterium RBG_13_39_9]|uniref:Uncharacterized protein n=1 Tax=Candidatus Buchananbacteria bacterium RBG_13_39_9 TaxID=1797531 RepID=A0A1G1XSA4_9BACT|nr:MAG: hypothetical protein A2Y67_02850 [Candidatus Buchananbacteria bacterium RBG_13_39_9]